MSITSDIRSYADKAVTTAQAQLNDVTGQANELVGKLTAPVKPLVENVTELRSRVQTSATDAVSDLRVQAEKAINLDAIKTAVEPYLSRVTGYQNTVAERAEALLDTVKKSVEPVVERVRTLTSRGKHAAKPAAKPAPAKVATKPVVAKAAPAKAAAKPAAKATARKAPAKKAAAKK